MSDPEVLTELRALWDRHWPQGVPRAPHYPFGEIPLSEYLREWARRQPAVPALIFYGTEISYAELDRLSDNFAALIAARGARPGDRIGVFLPNCPQFHIAFFGVLKAGCVHVPINPLFKEHELRHELDDTGAAIVVVQDALMPLVQAVRNQCRLSTVLVTSLQELIPDDPAFDVHPTLDVPRVAYPGEIDLLPALRAVTGAPPPHRASLDALAALNYTSGTTGMPKGCEHTQGDMLYTAATANSCVVRLQPAETCLCFAPIFWIAGEDMGLIIPVFAGATCVLLARWDTAGFLQAVERYRVSQTWLLVDSVADILDFPGVERRDLRSLQKVSASSLLKKLSVEYRARWRALTGGTLAEAAYGMTETQTFDTFTTGMQDGDRDLRAQPIFVGLPVPGTDILIRDFDTGAPLPLGQEGEITIRSPSVTRGYWRQAEATAASFIDGWLRTGDIGAFDEAGGLRYLGRRKEMLKVRGMSVFPAEIEALLGKHPDVVGSGVIGVEDARSGQVPLAGVTLRPGATVTEAELAAWCRDNMATYKVPRIRILPELPMTATGKVRKDALAQLIG